MSSAPSKSTYVINSRVQWLNGNAAASYLRMLAAGCPAGGISGKGAGRTYAEQAALYAAYKAGRGNLAARPGTSLHERGNALDVSRGTPAQLWMVKGGDAYNAKAGEKIRANGYGWVRTVNRQNKSNEPWHFAYDPSRDTKAAADLKARLKALGHADVKAFQRAAGLAADGKAGPQTWTALLLAADAVKPAPPVDPQPDPKPPEVPVPTTPTVPEAVAFRFGLANLQAARFGGLPDTSPRRGEYLRDIMRCSLYVLTEVPEKSRDTIRAKLGSGWKVYPVGYSTVMWDSRKWTHRDRMSVDFGTGVHGAVRAELMAANRMPVDVIGVHVRPAASFGGDKAKAAKGKQADIAKMLSLYRKGVSTIIAGDFNTPDTLALARAGLVRATPAKDSLDEPGDQPLDQVWVTPELIVRDAELLNPGSVTDHKVWVVKLTIGGGSTL